MAYFTGYAVIKEKENGNREDDSDVDGDSEDEDENDFESTDFDFNIPTPSRQLGQVVQEMKELQLKNGRVVEKPGMVRLRGKFDRLFSNPWWTVKVKINTSIKSSNNEKLACKLPSYSYRTDEDVGEDVLSLFLTKGCKVHEQHAAMFLEFTRNNNLRPTLKNLIENLNEFRDSNEDNQAIAEQIQAWLDNSQTGKAFSVPEFTKFAHRLLPRHVCSIFDDFSQETLQRLNEAIKTEPWIFGYWTVLTSRYQLSGCEAKLASFQECNLFQEMPIIMQDALRIYDTLCRKIRKCGHTYVHLSQLKMWETNVTNWKESLSYLSTIDEVKTSEDHLGDRRLVFLPYLRRFEQNIAYNLSSIMDEKTWIGKIDIDEQEFGGDEDQIKAAKLITKQPVVVMSGRGGCGKTYVVSKVLSKALEIKKESVCQEFCDNLDDVRMSDFGDEEAKPSHFSGLNTQIAQYPDHKNALEIKKESARQEFCDNLDDARMSNSGDEEAKPSHFSGLNTRIAQYPDHKNDRDGQTVEQDLWCDPATSTGNCEPDSQVSEYPSSEGASLSHEDKREMEEKLKAIDDAVLLTAPTGKAASILGRRTGLQAHTLHSVIYSCVYWEQKLQEKDDWKFSKVRLLVCDECSLVSVRLFSKLVSSLTKWSQLQQIILLGDINQLPSIEPGNFLSDVYHALAAHSVAVSLTTNHRADSDLIVQNAVKISNRRMPVFDPSRRFVSVPYHLEQRDKDIETNKVTQVVKNVLQRKELQDHTSSQFVAFRRVDCRIINERCALHYNNHSILDRHRKPDYQVGDKICIRKNKECYDAAEKRPIRLCNGEIFFIKDIITEQNSQNKKRVFFSLDNGVKIIKISFQELRAAKVNHAWARTIHTFQGSEIDTLVYVVGRPYYQDWQHVYTAVTRGIKQVMIIHNPTYLQKAISSLPIHRQTKLKEDLDQQLVRREFIGIYWSDDDDNLEDIVQIVPQGVQSDGMGAIPACTVPDSNSEIQTCISDETVDGSHAEAAEASNVFQIARENLKMMKMKEEQHCQTVCCTTGGTSAESHQEMLQPASSLIVGDLQSSPLKRKYPNSESSAYLSSSKTPPPSPLKHFASDLSSVSPLNHKSGKTQQLKSPVTTPPNLKVIPAQFTSWCRNCKSMIHKGDDITYSYEGSTKKWVHGKCALCE